MFQGVIIGHSYNVGSSLYPIHSHTNFKSRLYSWPHFGRFFFYHFLLLLVSSIYILLPYIFSPSSKFITMKGMDLFCGSPSSTAICSSVVDHRSMVHCSHSSSDHHHRHRRKNYDQLPHVPCSSHLPINPRPYNNYDKSRKSYSKQSGQLSRKSSADILDLNTTTTTIPDPDSSRYLLSDSPFVDWFSDSDHHHVLPLIPAQPTSLKCRSLRSNDSSALKSSASTRSRHQVIKFNFYIFKSPFLSTSNIFINYYYF